MARTKQTGRRGAPPAKKAAKKKPASKAKKPSGAAAPAHPNELPISDEYDRCPGERFDLDTARTSFEHKPKPPRFIRGREFQNLPRSEDGWVPGEKKPSKCKLTFKQLAERWAEGVCIFMPVRDESESDSDSESESESEDESSDEVMPAKRARGPPKSHA